MYKHRFIHVFWTGLDVTKLDLSWRNVEFEDFVAYKISGELKDGAILATFRVVPTADHAEVKVKPSLAARIAFEESSAFGSKEIYAGLGELGGPVESIVRDLQAYW